LLIWQWSVSLTCSDGHVNKNFSHKQVPWR